MKMKLKSLVLVLLLSFGFKTFVSAQTISKEEMVFLTSEWKGERFPDGRPRIPDDLLVRAKHIMIDDAWTVLKNAGYLNQYEGNWKMVSDTTPMTGRAVTAMYMPSRPDLEKNIKARGAQQGRKGNTNSWPIDVLVKGDLYVADAYGKISDGSIMGSTLANSIFSKSGNGVVFDGAARDLQEIRLMKGFNALVRDFHPSFTAEMVLMGLNTPIHIGGAIVLPGDLVCHDWHHRGQRGDNWANAPYARLAFKNNLKPGETPLIEIWGLHNAINAVFDHLSNIPGIQPVVEIKESEMVLGM